MVAEFKRIESWRRPGCGDGCHQGWIIEAGLKGRRMVAVHDAEEHERYGRFLAGDLSAAHAVETGPLWVDLRTLSVRVDGREVHLSPTERRLLACLVEHCGHVVRHEALLTEVWGEAYQKDFYLLRAVIGRLRARLGSGGAIIRTQPSIGFWLIRIAPGAPIPRLPAGQRPTLADRGLWARYYERCRACGTTDHPHYGRGVCIKCRGRHVKMQRAKARSR